MASIQVAQGFSPTNRCLLYTSLVLSPAQFVSGLDNQYPTNLAFIAYNWYSQLQWYGAIRTRQLHALSLLPVHFNMLNVFTYLGGISSGNIVLGTLLGVGTAGVIVLNTVSAWVSWATNLPEGFDSYQFYFFGWRTLDSAWHKFFLLWQIGDSGLALSGVIASLVVSVMLASDSRPRTRPAAVDKVSGLLARLVSSDKFIKYPAIPIGAMLVLLVSWPLILWTELVVSRNNIESETDLVAVALFGAQAGSLLLPSFSFFSGCCRKPSSACSA